MEYWDQEWNIEGKGIFNQRIFKTGMKISLIFTEWLQNINITIWLQQGYDNTCSCSKDENVDNLARPLWCRYDA
jgi:hypothetical protein